MGQLTAVKNHERFSGTSDASANPTSSEEEILESTPSNEYESGDMCENEYHAAKRVEIDEVSESSGDISDMTYSNNILFRFINFRITSFHWPRDVEQNYRIVREF